MDKRESKLWELYNKALAKWEIEDNKNTRENLNRVKRKLRIEDSKDDIPRNLKTTDTRNIKMIICCLPPIENLEDDRWPDWV